MRYLICSKPKYLQEELDHIANVFNKLNNYPTLAIKQLLGEVKYNHHETSHEVTQINEVNNGKKYHLLLPRYSRSKGEKLIRLMKKTLKSKLPDNIVTKSAYMATRLRDKFNIKTKIVKEHHHDISYCVECPEENSNENYVGEAVRRLSKRVIDHNVGDKTLTYSSILLRGNIGLLVFMSLVSWEIIILKLNFAEHLLSFYL